MRDLRSNLLNAYTTWVRDKHDNQWVVYNNKNEEVFRFPHTWKEKDCSVAMKFARKFADESHVHGVEDGLAYLTTKTNSILKQTDAHIRLIEEENGRLSEKLEKLIIGSED